MLCKLCNLKENDMCLHLISCCTIKHINNLITNRHNKAAQTLTNTLKAHLATRCFTLINVSSFNYRTLDKTIPSWLLPCSCYLPRCACPTKLQLDILRIIGAPPSTKPLLKPSPNVKIHILQ